jgi:hypothetical protein
VNVPFFISPTDTKGMTTDREGVLSRCPGCGLLLPETHGDPPPRWNASPACLLLASDLACYTVAKQDPEFIHQHAVDAYAAQHAGGQTRNITVVFGLIGLYLAVEKGYKGRQVQQAHMRIARTRRDWPRLEPPARPAGITVQDVLLAGSDAEKDAMIRAWMAAVWESWADRQAWVRETTATVLGRAP